MGEAGDECGDGWARGENGSQTAPKRPDSPTDEASGGAGEPFSAVMGGRQPRSALIRAGEGVGEPPPTTHRPHPIGSLRATRPTQPGRAAPASPTLTGGRATASQKKEKNDAIGLPMSIFFFFLGVPP